MKQILVAISFTISTFSIMSCNNSEIAEKKLDDAASILTVGERNISPVIDFNEDYYLVGGDILLSKHDPDYVAWGESFLKRSSGGNFALRGVLSKEWYCKRYRD